MAFKITLREYIY